MPVTGNIAYEKTIALGIVGDPKLFDYVADVLEPEAFGDPLCRGVYQAVRDLTAEREKVTQASVTLRLRADLGRPGWFDGGKTAGRTTGEEVRQYGKHLAELHVREKLRSGAMEIAVAATGRPATETASALRALADGQLDRDGTSGPVTGRQAIEERIGEVEASIQDPAHSVLTTFQTGLGQFDPITGGLAVGRLTVFAARPSQGKSAVAVALAHHLAVTGVKVGLFWLEDEQNYFADRLLARHAGISFSWSRHARSKSDLDPAKATDLRLLDNILIDSSKGLTSSQIAARMRRMARVHGVRVFVVDHLGEVRVDRGEWGDRHDLALGEAVRAFRNAAIDLRAAPVLFAQQNRQGDARKADAPPRMSDIQGSGQIEQTARILAFIKKTEDSKIQFTLRKPVDRIFELEWDKERATVGGFRPRESHWSEGRDQ